MKESEASPEELEELALESYRSGQYERSIERYTLAREHYSKDQNSSKAAEIANNLCVVLLAANQPQAALELVRDTPDYFLSQGDENRAAQASGNLASALEACGQNSAAEHAYHQAIDLFDKISDSENYSSTLQALSRLQLRQGKPLEALSTMQSGLETMPKARARDRLLRQLLKWPFRLIGR
ncbi:MAG: tetratricopeptide repeat protein [Anaerolineales bacterium]|jgi:tetratricopeptide (TPR) repeat protein